MKFEQFAKAVSIDKKVMERRMKGSVAMGASAGPKPKLSKRGPLTPMGGWTGVLVNENPRWRSISPFARVESWTPPNVWSIDSSRRADEGCVSSFPKF